MKGLLLLLLVALISACQTVNVNERPAEPPVVSAEPAGLSPEALEEIQYLLDEAYLAMEDNHLTTPLDDNAYFRYLQVLSIDPDNPDALLGLSDIVERYLDWALDALQAGQIRQARDYLNRARSVDEEHPSIPAVESRIRRESELRRKTFLLPSLEVKDRTQAMMDELRRIGTLAHRYKARVIITARNDAEGRWIYQQLNNAAEARIRARVEMGRDPAVRLEYREL